MYVCRIGIDEWLRVPSVPDVFAIGDCCGYLESTGKSTLPALAQVRARYPLLFSYLQSYGYMHICKLWVFTEITSLSLGVDLLTSYPRTLPLCGIYRVCLVDPTSVWDLPGPFSGPYICVGFTGYVWFDLCICYRWRRGRGSTWRNF